MGDFMTDLSTTTRLFDLIRILTDLGERQGQGEKDAGDFLMTILTKNHLSFVCEPFETVYPTFPSWILEVDHQSVSCQPTCFVGGQSDARPHVLSSLDSFDGDTSRPIINHNPDCPHAISRPHCYPSLALAVCTDDLSHIISGTHFHLAVDVCRTRHQSQNVLVGNQQNPRRILFAHYDSLGPGAVDNASGVVILLHALLTTPEIFQKDFCVFVGNEERSFDTPCHWGHGYRAFELRHKDQLHTAKQLVVIDCVGHERAEFLHDLDLLRMGLPLQDIEQYLEKTMALTASFAKLMAFYHSPIDTIDQIYPEYLLEALAYVTQARF